MKIISGELNELTRYLSEQTNQEAEENVEEQVKIILKAVKETGDTAVVNYTEKFDGVALSELRLSKEQIQAG